MNNVFILSFFLLISVCTNVGCTAQRSYLFAARFHNICEHSVRIRLWSFSHFEKEFIEKDMNPGDTAEILSTIANYDTIESGVLPTYRFEISYNNRSRNFNQEQFLDLLKKTKKDGHVWIINDASLCP